MTKAQVSEETIKIIAIVVVIILVLVLAGSQVDTFNNMLQ